MTKQAQPKGKYARILLTKDPNDTSTNKFFSYNLTGFTIKVGEQVEIPYDAYENAIAKSHLKDRVVLLGVIEK